MHVHQSRRLHGHSLRWRDLSWRRRIILLFTIFIIIVGAVLLVLYLLGTIQSTWIGIISISFTAFGVVIASFQWLYPVDPDTSRITSYHGIIGKYPSINPNQIIWRERIVQEVYERLINPNISAIVLRGLNGVGTTTLASLICHYAEEQYSSGLGPFIDKALWFYIDATTTFPDLAEELSLNFKKPLPDLNHIASQLQAEQVFKLLDDSKTRRLIVLDFKNPLDKQTKDALADRPGFKEFFKILNSQPCSCRVLVTSRPWSAGSIKDVPDYVQEYNVRGLNEAEGIELLEKYNVEGADNELRSVVKLCSGHPGAIIILTNLLNEDPEHSMSLTTFLGNRAFIQGWMQEVASEYHLHIYNSLEDIQRELLFAFSFYRKPVPIAAVEGLITERLSEESILVALRKLIKHCLFQFLDEKDHYCLHPCIADYAQDHFGNTLNLKRVHIKASIYYQGVVRSHHLGQELESQDIELLKEAIWHLLQADQHTIANKLVEEYKILKYLL